MNIKLSLSLPLVLATLALVSCGGGLSDPDAQLQAAQVVQRAQMDREQLDRGQVQVRQATTSTQVVDATAYMDWAQTQNPGNFPGAQPTVQRSGFVFRYYPGSGNFIIVMGSGDVYHLGPVSGGKLSRIGALADFTCNIFPSSCASSIVGTWTIPGNNGAMVTFFSNGDFMQAQWAFSEPDPVASQVWPGLERSTYVWNTSTGALTMTCPSLDTNGTAGPAGTYTGGFTGYKGDPIGTCRDASQARTVQLSGNTMSFTTAGGTATLTRLVDTSNTIVGSWFVAPSSMLTFFSNGDFVQTEWRAANASLQSWPGVERATYTWNASTGTLTLTCPSVDTNGSAGISDGYTGGFTGFKGDPIGTCKGAGSLGAGNTRINGDTLTLVIPEGTLTATRVK